MTILHMVVWVLGVVILPVMPIGAGWAGAYFAGIETTFREYIAETVQDGQLFFYCVALGSAEGIEAWEWRITKVTRLSASGVLETVVNGTPFRGVVAILAAAVVMTSIFFYGMIAALRPTSANAAGSRRRKPIAVFSLVFALSAAIIVIGSHMWIRSHGG